MGKALRLDKLLSDTGRWSRKEARELVRSGVVCVDGTVVRAGESKADPETQTVTVRGERIGWQEFVYLLLYKPAGYLTATEDAHAPTVMDLVPEEYRRSGLAPVGRLDKDTTGLLLLTDDGGLNHALCSPRHHVDKVYLAQVEGEGSQADVDAFAAGITLGDGTKCLPARLELVEPGWCRVTVREGKFHQVKRMLASRGLPVKTLKRESMGPLGLGKWMKEGEIRPLTVEEVGKLRESAGVDGADSSKYTK